MRYSGASLELGRSGFATTTWATLGEARSRILPHPPRVPRGFRSLTGRLVLRQGREITLEIDVNQPFEWDPVAAEVTWPDGTKLEAEIAWERTTRQGPVEAGQVIRVGLCLKADGPFLAPSQFSVTTATPGPSPAGSPAPRDGCGTASAPSPRAWTRRRSCRRR